MDFGKAVFGGGGEVEGVGGAEIGGGRGAGEDSFDLVADGIGEGQPFQVPCGCLIMDLREEGMTVRGSGRAFPDFPERGGSKWLKPIKMSACKTEVFRYIPVLLR